MLTMKNFFTQEEVQCGDSTIAHGATPDSTNKNKNEGKLDKYFIKIQFL